MMSEREAHTQARKPWSLEGIEGAAIRKGRAKHLDKELELPQEEIRDVRIPVMQEMYDALEEVIAENGWEWEEGLRTMLAAGLGYARVDPVEEAYNHPHTSDEYNRKFEQLRQTVARYEANYSVMKFKAYQFQEKARILEMRVNGLEGTERFRETWALRIRDRLEALEEEHQELERRVAEYEQRAQQALPDSVKSPTWWQRFRELVADFSMGGRPEGTGDGDGPQLPSG